MKRALFIAVGLTCLLASGFAARKSAPSGAEISQKAMAAMPDHENSASSQKAGKKIKITPVRPAQIKSEAELEDGQVIAVLETDAEGDETGLPAGKYNLFATKVGRDWHVYAESGGRIAAEGVRVRPEKTVGPRKAAVSPRGWCVYVSCYWGWWACF